ncbi:MerR family transcriptional regulator [Amycolatopsis sp. NPDC051373]|uniref:MerR family transcriptional regulator n=1 Tax=Amycolatopsis sp. NPDC051373 TaxID=3155801 RepID=UPI00344C24DC
MDNSCGQTEKLAPPPGGAGTLVSVEDDEVLSIGELARRARLSVKAVRYYSDVGLVPTAGRDSAGRRRYSADAVGRLGVVRTLRALGVGLKTIRAVVGREAKLSDVAAGEAEAIEAWIKVLQVRRAVLLAVARNGVGWEEVEMVHELAAMSAQERRNLIKKFLEAVFGGLDARLAGIERTLTPELPDDPTPEQVDAWVELGELTQDPEFRTALRDLAAAQPRTPTPVRDVIAEVAGINLEADPQGPDGAEALHHIDPTPADLARINQAKDPRRDRYLRLLATINGWATPTPLSPALEWFEKATRHHSPNLLAK